MVRASTTLGLIKLPVGTSLYTQNNAEGTGISKPNDNENYSVT